MGKFLSIIRMALFVVMAASLVACNLLAIPTPFLSSPTSNSDPGQAPSGARTITPEPNQEPTPVPNGTLVDITSAKEIAWLKMLDNNVGFMLSDLGFLQTNDGGSNWRDITPPEFTQNVYNVAPGIVTPETLLLLSMGETFDSGKLFRSNDGGEIWYSYPVPFSVGSFQFLDEENGFFLASLGVGAGSNPVSLFKTSDGGTYYDRIFSTIDLPPLPQDEELTQEQLVPDALGNAGIKSGFVMLDTQRGWIVGSIPMDNYIYLYATRDGGSTWQRQDIPLPDDGFNGFYSPEPPVFFDATTGVLPIQRSPAEGGDPQRLFYVTYDGGVTWQAQPAVNGSGPFSAATASDWYFWNSDGLLVTHDTGGSWQLVPSNLALSEPPSRLLFTDPIKGWWTHTTEDGVHFYTTNDGGVTWEPIIP